MKLYKLTNENYETRNNTKWGENVTHTASGKGGLCSSGWLHAYLSPELAALLNPIHANFSNPILWEAEGEVELSDNDLKVGCKSLKTIKIIDLPLITIEQRVEIAIRCALEICKDEKFTIWVNNWLDGTDRSASSADATDATYATAAYYAASAAYYAANAAYAAAAAYYAADAAYHAAYYAPYATDIVNKKLNIQEVINEVLG
jgi:hypothetical protein